MRSNQRTRGRAVTFALACALLACASSFARAQSGVAVSFSDKSVTLPAGASRQFTPTVTGTTNTAVTWTVNGVAGGNATVGTIDATGKYTAPAGASVGTAFTITATSVADPTASASLTLTIRYPNPQVTSVTPNPLPAGPFKITINGNLYAPSATVDFRGNGDMTVTGFAIVGGVTLKGNGRPPRRHIDVLASTGPQTVTAAVPPHLIP